MHKLFSAILMATAAAATVACGNGKGEAEAEAEGTPLMMPFARTNVDTTTSILSIKDNEFEKAMPKKLFYGEADSAQVEKLWPGDSVPSSISCFVVEKDGKRALFDTGNGKAKGGKLVERLAMLGLSPDSIDYLFITHFHADHIGGMTYEGKPVFARCEVYVPQDEYDHWVTNGDPKGSAARAMATYRGRLHRFGYADRLPMGVVAMAAPGHTPGHTVYQIGRIIIVGDLYHGLSLQIQDSRLCADYDMDRKQAIASRDKFTVYALKNGLLMAGMHFPRDGMMDFKIDTDRATMPGLDHR